ncbi:MAG: LysR family transcriptional regulator [Beijerinckiaceae bacterium]|jgi:DNA-binding transcriptional LysR family regulator|nr:LysR family transcriptional regulator [Beijerinckiaceae bacterium]
MSPSKIVEAEETRRPSLRELEILRALITLGKTTAAAAKLNISQPAVSRAIAQLEERTGLVLFRRESGRLLATAEALALQKEAEPIFQTLERLERARWRPVDIEANLRIACPPTLALHFLNGMLARFSMQEQNTRVHLEIGSGIDVITKVADGETDLGLIDGGAHHVGVRFIPFRLAEAHVMMLKSSHHYAREIFEPKDFDDVPLIALVRRFPSRIMLDRLFLGANVTPRILIEVSTAAAAYDFVRGGAGLSIANPFPISFRGDPDVGFRPFRPVIPYETSFILPAMTPPTPVARRFIDFVRQHQDEDGYTTALRNT